MKKQFLFLCVVVACLCCSSISNADVIVDTGEPQDYGWGRSVFSDQWLAGKFILDQAYGITDIYGYMGAFSPLGCERSLTIAIYEGGDQIPNVSNEIYNQSITIELPSGLVQLWASNSRWSE